MGTRYNTHETALIRGVVGRSRQVLHRLWYEGFQGFEHLAHSAHHKWGEIYQACECKLRDRIQAHDPQIHPSFC
jgi:hypothetical protein